MLSGTRTKRILGQVINTLLLSEAKMIYIDTSKYTHHVGYRQYELSNHLGNVMAVISDRKIARDTSANDTVDYYEPDVLLTFDYSPFGAPLHARSFSKEVCHDTTFTMVVEDLNTNFDDGTTQGWQILSTTTQLAVTGGRLRAYKQGKGAGTLGVQQSFMATNGVMYDFTITIENDINPASTVVLEVLDPNNTVIYTQSVSNGSTNTFNTQFTANISGVYVIKVYRTGNNASGSIYIDDVLVTHEEEVTELICEDYSDYKWGHGSQLKDNQVAGKGNHYTAPYWEYDPRIGPGGRWNPDPVTYAWQSPYTVFNNNPIFFNDPSGAEGEEPIIHKVKKGENLTQIAKQFNTTVKQIVKDNSIKDPNLIFPGQELVVGQALPEVEINAQEQEKNKLEPLDFTKSKEPFKDVVKYRAPKLGGLDLYYEGKKIELRVVSLPQEAATIKAKPALGKKGEVISYEIMVKTIHHKNFSSKRGATQFNILILRFSPEDKELYLQTKEFIKGNNNLFK